MTMVKSENLIESIRVRTESVSAYLELIREYETIAHYAIDNCEYKRAEQDIRVTALKMIEALPFRIRHNVRIYLHV